MKPFEGFLDDLYESNGEQNDDVYNHSQRFDFQIAILKTRN